MNYFLHFLFIFSLFSIYPNCKLCCKYLVNQDALFGNIFFRARLLINLLYLYLRSIDLNNLKLFLLSILNEKNLDEVANYGIEFQPDLQISISKHP